MATHLFLFNEPFLLLLSIHIVFLWYQADHSENLRLYHYAHHTRVDSVYTSYTKIRFPGGEEDKVKPLLAKRSSAGSRDTRL